jgi:hypothetical protein
MTDAPEHIQDRNRRGPSLTLVSHSLVSKDTPPG